MPRKPGVSNVLATAPISKSGSAAAPGRRSGAALSRPGAVSPWPGSASWSLRLSQRTGPMIEQQFDSGKRVFDDRRRFLAERDGKERIKILWWGIVEVSPHCALGGRWRHGAFHGRAAHSR